MQNAAQMAVGMNNMNANPGGPVDGTPMMSQRQHPTPKQDATNDPRNQLNTYIYDYFLRNGFSKAAKSMIECEITLNLQGGKSSPGSRNVNGVNAVDGESRGDLPEPNLPQVQAVDNSFLMDWWCQFWDVFSASRHKSGSTKGVQYAHQARMIQRAENQTRKTQMDAAMNMPMNMIPMTDQQRFHMMRMQQNGVDPNALKRAAVMNRNPNGVGPMGNATMNKQMMQAAQMQREGSNMDINGQRGQSPNSNDNAPSPNKRARVEGALSAANMAGNQFGEFAQQGQNVQQKPIEVYAQNLALQHRIALNNHALPQAMNPGVQGSPMNPQGLEGQQELYNGNGARQGIGANQPGGNHALQDYQMQLMLLEQQNKKRLLLARQEQDGNPMGPGVPHQPGVANPTFPPQAMSPQGRPGPSPNPSDQMKRTPKLNQPGLPGSPMPDPAMQQQRSSPAPGMGFDVNQVPPGMPPQFPAAYGQMGQPMMRPPSSHPPGGFNPQQLTAQQMDMMRQNGMANAPWRGAPGPQGMMPGQAQQMNAAMANPQQRNQMPPPPAPAGDQPRAQEPSPSQTTQAPPTPSQTAKGNPKKKPTKDNKKPAKAKGANAGATPASSAEDPPPTPTPSTPITPMHKSSFTQNGQQPNQQPAQAQAAIAPPQPSVENHSNPPFGSIADDTNFAVDFSIGDFNTGDPLTDFDFDSFMHNVGEDDPNGLSLGDGFGFGDEVQASGDI